MTEKGDRNLRRNKGSHYDINAEAIPPGYLNTKCTHLGLLKVIGAHTFERVGKKVNGAWIN